MTTLALVTRARGVAQARWEQARRVKEIAIAAERRYQALLYELYAEEEGTVDTGQEHLAEKE